MIGAIVQARMGATRLPGKVLLKVNGIELLKYQIERIRKSKKLDKVVIATTLSESDDIIVNFCKTEGINYFRGSENDVLSRYFECAKANQFTTIVRLTADCPLIDPLVIDHTIRLFEESKSDFTANTVPPETSTFPDGSDVEVFSFKALERAYFECKDSHFREHVTFFFWKAHNQFKCTQLINKLDYSKFRITLDYPEDYEVIKFIINTLKDQNKFGSLEEIVEILDKNTEIKNKNSKYFFGIGWEKSSV